MTPPTLTYATFCSGIEGVSVAWEVLGGFEPLFFCEIEPFPCAVLAHHWPQVSNFGDMTQLDCSWWRGKVNVVWGSTPCQAFSFAGRRRGLGDKRGALTLAFCERVDEIAPDYVLWENVKGVLSDKSNAFGCLLGALAGEDGPLVPPGGKWAHAGYVPGPKRTIAWRLFDAQHGGVPQRRERVFVVASAAGRADPRDILFEREGVRRDFAPERGAEAAVAAAVAGGPGQVRAADLTNLGLADIFGTLEAGQDRLNRGQGVAFAFGEVSKALTALTALTAHGGPHGRQDVNSDTFLVCATGGVTHALKAEGADASEDGTGRGNPIVAFSASDDGCDAFGDLSPTLRARASRPGGKQCGSGQIAVATALRPAHPRESGDPGDWEPALDPLDPRFRGDERGGEVVALSVEWENVIQARVRRLTPLECERLQGLPDHHTRIPWRGRPAALCPDGPRYKAIGNGLAIPDVRWLGWRLQRFHALKLRELAA